MKYRLTKVSDDKFNGKHPNFILEGMFWEGYISSKPKIGERWHFGIIKDHPRNHLLVSTVTQELEKGIFKTRNSTYKLEEI